MQNVTASQNSIRNIAGYFGHRQQQLSVKGLFDDIDLDQILKDSVMGLIKAALGEEIFNKIALITAKFKVPYHSPVWEELIRNIQRAASEHSGEEEEAPRIYFDEFNTHDVKALDEIEVPPGLLEDIVDGKPVSWQGIRITLVHIIGDFKLGVEGVVQWPLPDPDLVFRWDLKILLDETRIKVVFGLRFEGVEGPNLGWLMAIIGFYTAGAAWAAIGFGSGAVVDELYESRSDDPRIAQALTAVYDGTENVLTRARPAFSVRRPNSRSFEITMDVEHAVSALTGFVETSLRA